MEKCSNIGGKIFGKREIRGRGEFRKKMYTSQIPSQNESMYEVSSKSDNGSVEKNRGKILRGRGELGGEEF